jgi:aspartyl/asparaginyl-tRNA synthetase
MIRTPVAGLRGQIGKTVTIAGWAQALRLQRTMQFIIVREHTGTVQVTHRRDGSALERALEQLTTESAVQITGRVQANQWYRSAALSSSPRR